MAYTQAQIDALKTSIASGVLTVRHGEKTVTYRSLAEMQELLSRMEADVAGGTRRRLRYLWQSDKGL
jgi:hypothetical protein